MPKQAGSNAALKALAANELDKAIHGKGKNEDTIRGHIESALKSLERETEPGFNSGVGPCDIFLPARRFFIETKRPGKADPKADGRKYLDGLGRMETQFEQCARYVEGGHESERLTLGMDEAAKSNEPWQACLTDGRIWWIWEWDIKKDGSLSPPSQPYEKQPFSTSSGVELANWLENLTGQLAGKLWVPKDTAAIFRPYRDELAELFWSDGSQSTKTKLDIWLEMLRGSGSDPKEPDKKDLFIQHTLLVTVARAVIASLLGKRQDPTQIMSEGFTAWPHRPNQSGASSKKGEDWTNRLFETAHQFDWRQRGRDVLRDLYQDLVSKEHRKDYGEYYTPDWLTEGVVEDVLDDAWIERSIEAVIKSPDAPDIGVLDPACGSGTFLFHAARRILSSEAIKKQEGLTDVRRAEIVTSLVIGIDIHPVAVEMAKATLLRALPCSPPDGDNDLQIFQGDSLLWNKAINIEGEEKYEQLTTEVDKSGENFLITTPDLNRLKFPISLVTQKSFRENISILVKAAWQKKPMPTPRNLNYDEKELAEQYETLKQIIEKEGDNVWAWYIFNATGPIVVRMRGVDRIVANPPWVRMSSIQKDLDRKVEFEDLARKLELWGKRKVNTGLDIAAMFVIRCSDLYLQPNTNPKDKDAKSGWVLPWGSLRAENWEATRRKLGPLTREIWDLSKVKSPPFTGSKSAVWLLRHMHGKKKVADTKAIAYVNKGRTKVELNSTWKEAEEALTTIDIKQYPIAPSDYANNHKSEFTQGAPIVPHCLVKIGSITSTDDQDKVEVVAVESRHAPWKNIGSHKGVIPKRWVTKVVTSSSLLPFYIATPDQYVIPLHDGSKDPAAASDPYWFGAEEQYEKHRGQGESTGKDLFAHINFNNALLKQTQRQTKESRIVIYNSAGSNLRASRHDLSSLIEYSLFWTACSTEAEAKYLTAIINANCLQDAFRLARKSDRHFQAHFWHTIPIPRFDKTSLNHTMLTDLCGEAEAVASKKEELSERPKSSQIGRSKEIREALQKSGVSARIDKAVAKLLPDHVS